MRLSIAIVLVSSLAGASACGRLDYSPHDAGERPDAAPPDGRVEDGASLDAPIEDGGTSDADDAADAGDAGDSGMTTCAWADPARLDTPVPLDAVNSTTTDVEPVLSWDGLTLHFGSNRLGMGTTLFVARRAARDAPFGPAVPATELEGAAASRIELSRDGLTAIVSGWLPGGEGEADIFIGRRSSTSVPFTTESLSVLSTVANDWDGHFSHDELAVYGSIETAVGSGIARIHVSRRASLDAPFEAPAPVPDLVVGTRTNGNVSFTPDGLVAVLAAVGTSSWDLYIARRARPTDDFGPAEPLAAIDTEAANEWEPFISRDGCELFFVIDTASGGPDIFVSRVLPP